ncbi:MAG TPA: hypothetical protein VFU89_06205 [Rhabdochlamydiaceae bacterium]|nr:hypothetical protein [Rhabdochlamydiaceae bacterium]
MGAQVGVMHPIRAISAIVVFATTVLYSTVSTTAKASPIYLEQNLQNGSQSERPRKAGSLMNYEQPQGLPAS